MYKLRFRQIHLDFHTSPMIENIGGAFDKEQWQKTLKESRVNSITCFSKCHHGWSYHPTEVGQVHPHLTSNLLLEQFNACKEIDVNVPVYLSAGVDNVASYEHPEWREVGINGQYNAWVKDINQPGFHKMCFNSPYLDYLCEQIKEAVKLFPGADGIFLDIISQGQCCCRWCLEEMDKNGWDINSEADRKACAELALEKYYQQTTAAAKCDNPDMPVMHNSGNVTRGQREVLKYFSHLELESLPTGGWGYDHFPISAKYCQNLDYDFLGMTGKFHTTWGEFGGYKHPNALRYECAAMLAHGAKCSIGDQLHPNGKIDESTYNIIGAAYREVEEKEKWCNNVESIADIALLSSVSLGKDSPQNDSADNGANRILLESQMLFDVIDGEMDFSKYKVLVLPDNCLIDAKLKAKLDDYLAAGGKLFLTGKSGMDSESKKFVFDIGAEYCGESEYQPDYIVPRQDIQSPITASPLVMYLKSQKIKVKDGESLGDVYEPYFNRTYKHFCSHQHTPPKPEASGFACGVYKNNILYLAHPVFSLYFAYGAVAYKDYCVNALKLLLGDDLSLTTNMPSISRVTMMNQPAENRLIMHLLYANTINRGGKMHMEGGNMNRETGSIEVIEELMPLNDVEVSVKLPEFKVNKITLEPQGKPLEYKESNGVISFKLDSFTCHQMVVFQ
jgi:hypothetical protein